jgi:hypothetical protein
MSLLSSTLIFSFVGSSEVVTELGELVIGEEVRDDTRVKNVGNILEE